jgi:2-(1,2-epoxy-1,2-dihydrophenyl)acetyl-CoA isomerase
VDTITLKFKAGVATLTLNRPGRRNAVNPQMRAELIDALERVRNSADTKALVITGAGGAFCAGGDLSELSSAELRPEDCRRRISSSHPLVESLLGLDLPVVAAVDGVAYGAGFSLLLMADFVIASPRARFCMSFLKVGLIPDLGALYTLPRVVGSQRAKELMLSAREIGPEEARRLGIVLEIHPEDRLVVRAKALAKAFVNASPLAVSLTKRALAASLAPDLDAMLEREADGQAIAFGSDYFRAASARFAAKLGATFSWPAE